MQKAVIQLDTLTCPSCALKIEGAIKSLEGINKESVSVLFNSSKVKVEFDESKVNADQIGYAITKLGYDVLKTNVK
ncbi:MAG: heavy-metal-associated domain-containing protein [Erysipelotrichaceae bacterium]|jgi:copper chaperone